MQNTPTHTPSLLGAILFALSGLFLLGIGLLMGFTAFFSFVTGETVQAQQTILFLAFGFEAALLFMIAFFAFQKTLHKPEADQNSTVSVSRLQILLCILVAAGAVLIGSQIGSIEPLNWLLLPVLTILAIVFPLGALLVFAVQRLPLAARWQSWTVLGLGMTLTPILLLILEIGVAIILFAGFVAYISMQPELVNELQGVARQIMVLGPQSEATQDMLLPYLTTPSVMFVTLLYIAVLVPAIEELCKPLGVWLLADKLSSTAQGFTLGALSGAGYALVETIGVSGQVSEWAVLLFTRIGTGLLHITTSALMGAAIVSAWRGRRYMRLIGTYTFVVLLHGLWNALAMLFTFSTLAEFLDQPGRLAAIQPWLIAMMSLLAVGFFLVLVSSNRRLRKAVLPLESEQTVPIGDIESSL
ncbi:MAG TPA: PrsW family glutamic-type intramembrane protease [Anaerolineales bacterium]|nr:PrsW family glutamic-type intramembrane protease [Anaerolineales bacterium]